MIEEGIFIINKIVAIVEIHYMYINKKKIIWSNIIVLHKNMLAQKCWIFLNKIQKAFCIEYLINKVTKKIFFMFFRYFFNENTIYFVDFIFFCYYTTFCYYKFKYSIRNAFSY